MITLDRGRWKTERTAEEQIATARDLTNDLSPTERLAFDALLQQIKSGSPSLLVDEVARVDWDEVPVPIEEWINSDELIGDNARSMFPKLKQDMIRLFRGNYHEVVLCLHPDTRIPLLDGTTPTIKELAERWTEAPEPFWVYGVHNERIVPCLAQEPRQTGEDDYFRITLDDGTTFTGNARHQMIMRDGTKRMIRDMTVGDSIMPFDVRLSGQNARRGLRGYEQVNDLTTGKWVFTHRIVAAQECSKASDDSTTIHHKNFKKLDNSPENLEWVRACDHNKMHGDHIRRLNLNGQAHRAGKLAWTNRSPEAKAAFSAMMVERNKIAGDRRLDVTVEAIQRSGASNINEAAELLGCSQSRVRRVLVKHGQSQTEFFGNRRGKRRGKVDVTPDAVINAIREGSRTIAAVAVRLDCAESTVSRAFKKAGLRWKVLCKTTGNHFVTKIEPAGRGPVFCMTVPATGNFAISTDGKEVPTRSGVFSSNTGSIGWG